LKEVVKVVLVVAVVLVAVVKDITLHFYPFTLNMTHRSFQLWTLGFPLKSFFEKSFS